MQNMIWIVTHRKKNSFSSASAQSSPKLQKDDGRAGEQVGCRSDALTMYMTGPMPDPWTTLELMLRMADFSWFCLVRCWQLEKKSTNQL